MSPLLITSILILIFMLGLLIEAAALYVRWDDPPCAYKLYAVRDQIIRLTVEGKIERDNPYFSALYQNVNVLLRCSRYISGPDGWHRAHAIGRHLAHKPNDVASLERLPKEVPDALVPTVDELRKALQHLVSNHFGILVQLDSTRREQARIQKERAKKLLAQMPNKIGQECAA